LLTGIIVTEVRCHDRDGWLAGAYFVHAAERDEEGVFSEMEEARSRLHRDFGEFLIEGDD
jgi:hypothetical protein